MNADLVGCAGERGEGAFVQIWLRLDGDRITEANYDTHGCPASVAAASMTATLARGRTLAEAADLTANDVLLILGGLPEGKEIFARLAVQSLCDALEKC